MQGRLFTVRYGRPQKLRGSQRVSIWIGAMQQKLKSATKGSISMAEVIDGGAQNDLQNGLQGYQSSAWDQPLTAAQKRVVDAIAEGALSGTLDDVTINYHLEKAVATPWNMLTDVSYDFSRRWQARVETGFIGRVQVLGT